MFMNNDFIKRELRYILDKSWEFLVLDYSNTNKDKKDSTKLSKEIIFDTKSEIDIINIISELYFVQTLCELQKNKEQTENINYERVREQTENTSYKRLKALREISYHHRNLLFLKKFFIIRLEHCLSSWDDFQNRFTRLPAYLLINHGFLSNELLKILDSHKDESNNNKSRELCILIALFSLLLCKNTTNATFRDSYTTIHKFYVPRKLYKAHRPAALELLFFDEAKNIIDAFNSHIRDCQTSILKLATKKEVQIFNKTFNVDNFYKSLTEALKNNLNKQNKTNNQAPNLENYLDEGISCYSCMTVNKTTYFSINGINDSTPTAGSNLDSVIKCLESILNSNTNQKFEYVPIPDNTRYYSADQKYITYKDFKDFKDTKNSQDKNLNDCNRMFTCCEKKLIAKLFNLNLDINEAIEIITSKPPCALCQRAFNAIIADDKCKYVIYPKYGEAWTQLDIEKYDRLTTELIKSTKCKHPTMRYLSSKRKFLYNINIKKKWWKIKCQSKFYRKRPIIRYLSSNHKFLYNTNIKKKWKKIKYQRKLYH